MQVDIKTKDIDLTDAIRASVEEKMGQLEPLLGRFGTAVTVEVEVGKTTQHHAKGPVFRAEVHIRLPNRLVYADAVNYDLYVAINDARKEAERQVKDYKETLSDRSHDGARQAKDMLSDIDQVPSEEEGGPEGDGTV